MGDMGEYQPLSSLNDLGALDVEDCVAGYRAGWDGAPEPGSDKSKSYWHGWRNAMMDKGKLPLDESARNLAAEYTRMQRAH